MRIVKLLRTEFRILASDETDELRHTLLHTLLRILGYLNIRIIRVRISQKLHNTAVQYSTASFIIQTFPFLGIAFLMILATL